MLVVFLIRHCRGGDSSRYKPLWIALLQDQLLLLFE